VTGDKLWKKYLPRRPLKDSRIVGDRNRKTWKNRKDVNVLKLMTVSYDNDTDERI